MYNHLIPVIRPDTTRAPRAGEVDGKAYHFVDKEAFLKLRSEDGFIETAEFAGNYYGTSKQAVKSVHDAGRRCILDIEAQVCQYICALPHIHDLRFAMHLHHGSRVSNKLRVQISTLYTSLFHLQTWIR